MLEHPFEDMCATIDECKVILAVKTIQISFRDSFVIVKIPNVPVVGFQIVSKEVQA